MGRPRGRRIETSGRTMIEGVDVRHSGLKLLEDERAANVEHDKGDEALEEAAEGKVQAARLKWRIGLDLRRDGSR